jgi:hypothetical protein
MHIHFVKPAAQFSDDLSLEPLVQMRKQKRVQLYLDAVLVRQSSHFDGALIQCSLRDHPAQLFSVSSLLPQSVLRLAQCAYCVRLTVMYVQTSKA